MELKSVNINVTYPSKFFVHDVFTLIRICMDTKIRIMQRHDRSLTIDLHMKDNTFLCPDAHVDNILFAYWILRVINLSDVRIFQICTNWEWILHRGRMTWEVSTSADYFLFISSVTRRSEESLQIWCKSVRSLWLRLSVRAQDERLHPWIKSLN